MTSEWLDAVTEAQEATGFTGRIIPRTVDGIGTALRLDHRSDFYSELGTLADAGAFDAFLNHWWTQAAADSAADAREQALDFADVVVSLYARATGGPTTTQAEIECLFTGAEVRPLRPSRPAPKDARR